MYDGFYNLSKKPFQLSADTEFFFNSAVHRRALAYMRYGLTQGEGFVVVTGKPGTGKTMLVKELVKSLDNDNIAIGIMVSSQVGADDLLKIISATFGLPYDGEDKSTLLTRIQRFFIQQARDGKRVLMIVDEAQNLPKDSLEELRMLTNFELSGKALFQIFLIGQPELGETLFLPELEQLRQRIVATYQLKPLSEEETKSYILFRLEKAGWNKTPEFEDDIFAVICSYTQGIPRRINTLCDRVLLFGYLEELAVIGLAAVNKVIAEIEEESSVVTDEFHDLVSASTSLAINADGTLIERIQALEKVVSSLQTTLNKERTLLRKAILIQLDMDHVYDNEAGQE
ncbi:MAG: XrtA-associated ATPase [Methylococcaceae bacterium]|jgi:putative secretion ATPase (PEP-CTERM system associated)|nr:XrtA-associated ATPase [Methylococcaceae bacterium]MDZ4156519.1 XrtA/PEP-CTERM system-associated ATPase [Methylococcales bacterium]MDP2393647.1 XrtA-associated ATPase [Methylococcaceae bacterium]MDP3020717.1 XrtA-associated ATPase [Methylococcaceae bacterium]MDP3390464.1 XrtA-associated ATPase [Methylococcaceae bacterium]